ncbi:MAG: AI-2E family transporter [Chloroflexota bacterium]|nr:AI-2E family transporter [Chloroflexota bacterium]
MMPARISDDGQKQAMNDLTSDTSPPWSITTKLLVGLSLIALLMLVLIGAQGLIAPLLLTFVLIHVLRPIVLTIHRLTRLNWPLSVTLLYLLLAFILGIAGVQLGGVIVEQVLDLLTIGASFVDRLPTLLQTLPLPVVPATIDLELWAEQALGVVQPLLTQVGGVLGMVATRAAAAVGWTLFILVISFFILLSLAPGAGASVVAWAPPGFGHDVRQLGQRISRIWRSFLYGQGLLFALTVLLTSLVFVVLGVRNALALALLAGFARFAPYIGPFLTWTLTAIVTFFQESNPWGLAPLPYTLIVVGSIIVLDQIFDNVISPRLFGQVLHVPPAAVLIAAVVAINLIGPVGLLLAAPLLATTLLVARYVLHKLFDLRLWPPESPRTDVRKTLSDSYSHDRAGTSPSSQR